MAPLLNKYYWNGVTLNWDKMPEKCSHTLFETKFNCSGLSNEVLCILVAQGSAKLLEVKDGGKKKIWFSNMGCMRVLRIRPSGRIFSDLQVWHLAVLQFLEIQGCIICHLKVLILEQLDLALKSVASLLTLFTVLKATKYCNFVNFYPNSKYNTARAWTERSPVLITIWAIFNYDCDFRIKVCFGWR